MSDEIFLLAKSGDKDAIANVIQTVEPFIIKQCRKMNLRNYDFEDLKQISYQAVCSGIKKIDENQISSAPSYLMKCIHNALKYEARRTLSKPDSTSIESEDKDGIKFVEKLIAEENTEDIFIKLLDSNKIKEAFNTLSKEEKDVISYFVHDSYGGLKRYSDLYHMDYRKVRYLKDKALKKLRLFLESKNDKDYFNL